jgi:hypothetical protein
MRRLKPIISDDISFWKDVRERSVFVVGDNLCMWNIEIFEYRKASRSIQPSMTYRRC